MKNWAIGKNLFVTALVLVWASAGCGEGDQTTEIIYGAMSVPKPSGPSCSPNPCLEETEGKNKCVLSPVGTECQCNDFYQPKGEGCEYIGTRRAVRSPSDQLDLSVDNPTFTTHIVVLGIDNKPIPGTKVQIHCPGFVPTQETPPPCGYQYPGGENADEVKEIIIDGIPLLEATIAHIRPPGYTPISKSLTWSNSGLKPLIVRPLPIEESASFDADIGQTVDMENIAVQITGDTFTRRVFNEKGEYLVDSTGAELAETYRGTVSLSVTSLDPEEDGEGAAPGEMQGEGLIEINNPSELFLSGESAKGVSTIVAIYFVY